MKTKVHPGRLAALLLMSQAVCGFKAEASPPSTNTVRMAAAQTAPRVIDFRLKSDEALATVEKNLTELERIVTRAGEAKCAALVQPQGVTHPRRKLLRESRAGQRGAQGRAAAGSARGRAQGRQVRGGGHRPGQVHHVHSHNSVTVPPS